MNFEYALNFRVRPVTDIHTHGYIFERKLKPKGRKLINACDVRMSSKFEVIYYSEYITQK